MFKTFSKFKTIIIQSIEAYQNRQIVESFSENENTIHIEKTKISLK